MRMRGVDAGDVIRPLIKNTPDKVERLKADLRKLRDDLATDELDVFGI